MREKEIELTDEQLEAVTGGVIEDLGVICPHCGSSNIVPFHSPSKGTAFLCCDCYRSFKIKKIEDK